MMTNTPSNKSTATTTSGSTTTLDLTRIERSNFYFGKTLGEGSYARVVHAKLKIENAPEFAVKIMEKAHIQREDKVSSSP